MSNVQVSFATPKQNEPQPVQNKPPAQSLAVQGACCFSAGGGLNFAAMVCRNPRFQLFVAEYLTLHNQSPYSLLVDENAYLFVQNNDPALLWSEFCHWFSDKQKQGRWINDIPPNINTPFEFGQQGEQNKPVHQAATIGQSPVTQTAPQATNQAVEHGEIDKPTLIIRIIELLEENTSLIKQLIGVLK